MKGKAPVMDDKHEFPASDIAQLDLAQLVGSRLCHDLVNPISAISNGLELLNMTGAPPSPELALISDALDDAHARIRFFRIGFGVARDGESISEREIRETLGSVYSKSRLSVNWPMTGDLPRAEVKLAFLMLNCAESALPLGGEVEIDRVDGCWQLHGKGRKLLIDLDLWQAFDHPVFDTAPPASKVHFALLKQEAVARGYALSPSWDEEAGSLELILRG